MANQPALISQVYIQVEGLGAVLDLMGDLISVTIESSLHLPDVATIVVQDTKLRWVDDKGLEPGKGVKISGKADEGEHPLFDGELVEIEPEYGAGEQRLSIRAFDRLHRLARGRHARSFVNVSDGDLVKKVAGEVGLQAKVGPASQVHPYVFQNNETNLAFLQRRAAALGYVLYVYGKELHFEPPKAEGQPIELQWMKGLHEFRPRMTTVEQVSGVTVRGWDPATRQEIVGQAKKGNGAPAVGERRGGGEMAQSAFHLEAPLLTADRPIRSQTAADQLAQALADRRATRFISADGSCAGDSRIVAGASVKIGAVGDRFSGTYLVTTARHVYAHGGEEAYATYFSISGQHPATLLGVLTAEPDGPPAASLVIGIVTDNQDPDGLGRVKVKYPWLTPDHASDWARVVAPGGGPDRGIQFLPEVNDEVLVGFEQGDVHHPYVLGGLWNGKDKPPGKKGEVVKGGKVEQRVIRTRVGHTITLDDRDGGAGITIEDKKGNTVKLDSESDALKMKVKGDVTIEAQGDLKLKAQGKVEISGMGVKIDGGGGTVDVHGSMINLN